MTQSAMRSEVGTQAPARDTAGVIARPPLVYLVSILAGFALELAWPTSLFSGSLTTPLGGSLIALAVLLFLLAAREMQKARTPIPAYRPTTAIVPTGPYRYSRNPIYLSFTLLHLGLGIWADSVWLLAVMIPTLVLMTYGVIAREERYLERRFGKVYLQYKTAVRRWL